MRRLSLALVLFLAVAGVAGKAAAQAAPAEQKREDIITPHITDASHLEVPWPSFKDGFVKEIELPKWAPVHIGPVELDLSPTKHVVMIVLAALLCIVTLVGAAQSQARSAANGKAPSGFANAIEAMVLYMRNEVVLPNVGHHGQKYVPYLLTLFFFLMFANLLGLVPYLSTATGNISVTATLAILSFFMIEWAGIRTLGKGYIGTIVYWPHDMPLAIKLPMTLIMTPVEIFGKFTKPFALAIRLFANMTAGHIVVLAFFVMIFTFGSWFIAVGPLAMAIAIMFLELFVAFLQAFIFTLLTAVFIGQIREAAH
jgi:F-type H+-transporting ATPase subunit a